MLKHKEYKGIKYTVNSDQYALTVDRVLLLGEYSFLNEGDLKHAVDVVQKREQWEQYDQDKYFNESLNKKDIMEMRA